MPLLTIFFPQRRYIRIQEIEPLATNTSPSKIRPSRWFYLIGIIVLIGGPAVSSAILFSTIFSNIGNMAAEIPSIQVLVPSSSDITLSQPGKYTVFYEYRSIVGNRVYSTGQDIPSIQINLVSKDTGDEIQLSSALVNRTYTIGSRSGVGLFDFVIDEPGAYELSASYPPAAAAGQLEEEGQEQEIVLAIIHTSVIEKIFGSIMGMVTSTVVVMFIPFVVGVAIIIITFIKRRKARARTRTTI